MLKTIIKAIGLLGLFLMQSNLMAKTLASPAELSNAYYSTPPNNPLIQSYLEHGGNPSICVPIRGGSITYKRCGNLTLLLIFPNFQRLALLAINKGGLKSKDEIQQGFEYSVHFGLAKVVKKLIQLGADVNSSKGEYGIPPLLTAVRSGNYQIVRLLTRAGANLNATDWFGYTAVGAALEKGFENIAQYLVLHGASLKLHTKSGATLLILASFSGSTTFVKALTALGFDTNARDNDGITPLVASMLSSKVSSEQRKEIVKVLIEHGTDVCYVEPRTKKSIIDYAVKFKRNGVLKLLRKAGRKCGRSR